MPEKRHRRLNAETITYIALLTAMQVILGNVTQLPSVGKQFNFGFLPIAAAAARLGAPAAMAVGGLGDFFGAHLFPQGAYFFGFTATNMLAGLLYALPLSGRKPTWPRVTVATLLVELCYLFLNSLWLSLLYAGKAYWGWVGARAVSYLFETPIYAVLTYLTLRSLNRLKRPLALRPRAEEGPGKETLCESTKQPSSRG